MMLIEITTKGFFAEPVLWQTSTFWPAVDDLPLGALLECVDACEELEWLELPCVELPCVEFEFEWLTLVCECVVAFEWVDAFARPFTFAECLVWPGAFADLP